MPDNVALFFAAKYRSGLVTTPIFSVLIPLLLSSASKILISSGPESLPSLPITSESILSALHFFAMEKAIDLILLGLRSSGYFPLISYSLKIV